MLTFGMNKAAEIYFLELDCI